MCVLYLHSGAACRSCADVKQHHKLGQQVCPPAPLPLTLHACLLSRCTTGGPPAGVPEGGRRDRGVPLLRGT
jgi:hypothetical protein